MSLIYRLLRCLLSLLVLLLGSDLSKEVELLVLRQENQVLRRQVRGRPRRDHFDPLVVGGVVPAGSPPPVA